jgi:hypothetical protein
MTDQTQQAAMVREAFETFCSKRWGGHDRDMLCVRDDGEYINGRVQFAWSAFQAGLGPAAPAVGAPVADDEGPACPNCEGTGAVVVLSDNGPDAYNVEECCPHCEGAGGLLEAYNGLYKLLNAERARLMAQMAEVWAKKHVPPAASLREQEDAARLEWLRQNLEWDGQGYWLKEIFFKKREYGQEFTPEPTVEEFREVIDAQRLGREKDKP